MALHLRNWLMVFAGIGLLGVAIGCASKPKPYVFDPSDLSTSERARAPRPHQNTAFGSTFAPGERPAAPAGRQPRVQQPARTASTPEEVRESATEEQNGERWWQRSRAPAEQEAPVTSNLADVQGELRPAAANAPINSAWADEPTAIPGVYRLRPGDPVAIGLRGIPSPELIDATIDDQGMIFLPYIPPLQAAGLTASQLQRMIRETYINERIYRDVTVNVTMPAQSYFVRGEVRQPGRFPLSAGMTVLQAIAAAGGYTEFANPRRIEIIRDGETMFENLRSIEESPELDFELKANDVIIVRRRIF